MFVYRRVVRLQDTDASGAIYFANLLQIALEAFEEYLCSQEFPLGSMLFQRQFMFPIVHTEADFFAPIFLSEELVVDFSFTKIGVTSFTHESKIYKRQSLVGKVSIVHVSYCSQKKKAIPHSEEVKNFLIQNFRPQTEI